MDPVLMEYLKSKHPDKFAGVSAPQADPEIERLQKQQADAAFNTNLIDGANTIAQAFVGQKSDPNLLSAARGQGKQPLNDYLLQLKAKKDAEAEQLNQIKMVMDTELAEQQQAATAQRQQTLDQRADDNAKRSQDNFNTSLSLRRAALAQQKGIADATKKRLTDNKLNDRVTNYTKALTAKRLPELEGLISDIDDIVVKYPDNLPGFGVLESWTPEMFQDEDSRKLRQNAKNLSDVLLRSRSGAQINDKEKATLEMITGVKKGLTEESFRNGLEIIRREFARARQNIDQGYEPEVRERYKANLGIVDAPTQQETAPPAKQVARKEYSKSANKTRITYTDGSKEILDGQR